MAAPLQRTPSYLLLGVLGRGRCPLVPTCGGLGIAYLRPSGLTLRARLLAPILVGAAFTR